MPCRSAARSGSGRSSGATPTRRFPVEVDVTAIELDGERRFLVRVRDLTDQERLQAELVQAQKMEATGQLVSGVAHELNNPLASILGFSQVIRRDPALPEELRHSADLLVEEATRTRRIVQNLLDFARQRPPERHPTSIRALVDSVLALQTYSLERGAIGVETDIPAGLPPVELDRGQLQQVLVNLTGNAIYAMRNGGGSHLRISAATEGPSDDPRVRVTVMDDGPGVPPEHVGRLFEAFFTTKPTAEGTGLGLSVSYGHRGRPRRRAALRAVGVGPRGGVHLRPAGPRPRAAGSGDRRRAAPTAAARRDASRPAADVRGRDPAASRPAGPRPRRRALAAGVPASAPWPASATTRSSPRPARRPWPRPATRRSWPSCATTGCPACPASRSSGRWPTPASRTSTDAS